MENAIFFIFIITIIAKKGRHCKAYQSEDRIPIIPTHRKKKEKKKKRKQQVRLGKAN